MLYCQCCELCSFAIVPLIMLSTDDYFHSWTERCSARHLEIMTIQE